MAAAPDHVTSHTASGPGSVRPAAFLTTHWSVVLKAQGESPAAQEALEDLCRTYWRPIYCFVRREGTKPEETKDITQGFFALILERKGFSSVDLRLVANEHSVASSSLGVSSQVT
jgi:hypothetical protein